MCGCFRHMGYLGSNWETALDDKVNASFNPAAKAEATKLVKALSPADRGALAQRLQALLTHLPEAKRAQILLLADRIGAEQDARTPSGLGWAEGLATAANIVNIVAAVASVGISTYGLIHGIQQDKKAKREAQEQNEKAQAEARAAEAAATKQAQEQQAAAEAAAAQAQAESSKGKGGALLVGGGIAAVAALFAAS